MCGRRHISRSGSGRYVLRVRAPWTVRRLLRERELLIAEIEMARAGFDASRRFEDEDEHEDEEDGRVVAALKCDVFGPVYGGRRHGMHEA